MDEDTSNNAPSSCMASDAPPHICECRRLLALLFQCNTNISFQGDEVDITGVEATTLSPDQEETLSILAPEVPPQTQPESDEVAPKLSGTTETTTKTDQKSENYTIDVKFVDSTNENLIHHVRKSLVWNQNQVSIVVQISKTPPAMPLHRIEDYNDSKNPFADDAIDEEPSIVRIQPEYDASKNPFNDDEDENDEDENDDDENDIVHVRADTPIPSSDSDLTDVSLEVQQNLT
jgi:hypothetical protein